MSFLRGYVREHGIYRRRFKKQKPYCTASPGIDPKPLPTSQRGDDMPAEACFNLGSSESPMSLQPASYVIPTEACARAWNLWEAVQETETLLYGL